MRVKMLRSLGRNLPDLIPAADKDAKDAVAGLMDRDHLLQETEVADVSDKEGDLLKKYGLAEDAAPNARLGMPEPQPAPQPFAAPGVVGAEGMTPGTPGAFNKAPDRAAEEDRPAQPARAPQQGKGGNK